MALVKLPTILGGLSISCILITLVPSNTEEITSLPGLRTRLHFKQYSGYLNANSDKRLFYWFVESEGSPSTDPLFLWLNGGPGCSSLFGFLKLHGPLHVHTDGHTLYLNPFRWNKYVSVLYLDAPAGVGFSYSADKNYTTDDDTVTEDNYAALQDFFLKFPQFKANDFYITGESYAGMYVPMLSVKVLAGPADINYKGFLIGNGLLDNSMNNKALFYFSYYHGIFGEDTWNKITDHCCNGNISRFSCNFEETDDACNDAIAEAETFTRHRKLNSYNIYKPCHDSSINSFEHFKMDNSRFKRSFENISSAIFCFDDAKLSSYLNLPQTRSALHVPNEIQNWLVCSLDIFWRYEFIYLTMAPQLLQILSSPGVRGLVYNGDIDMTCNFLGNQWFVEDLGLEVVTQWTPWSYADQLAGFYKRFKGLTFVTFKGAGHSVPEDQPKEALSMLKSFLEGEF